MKLSNISEARHISHGKDIHVNYDKDLIERVRRTSQLARNMSDAEIIEHIDEYLDEVTSNIPGMMDQLDYFNY